MAEFRLNCPGCGAEYVVPQDAIPAAGREVECSRCERVWQAQRPKDPSRPLDLADFTAHLPGDRDEAPAPLRPASKRLSPDVLDILRDEVEHERRLRAAEEDPDAPRPAVSDSPMAENDWPATTVTLPAQKSDDNGARRSTTPTVIRHLPHRSPSPQPTPKPASQRSEPTPKPAVKPRTVPTSDILPETAPQSRAARGYGTGFGISMLVTAALLALYLATPMMAAKGLPLADQLSGMRAEVDQARQWLSATLIPR
ncbi:MJ0042-type zinc finger domain-containing protein [Paracoccus sp. R86501]|uniref:MJ0042-type zinc finger domain-containing protein n=1 Tax=Paracoccus sp. R86501 TaxID=3101711 RepID=UPI00366C8B0A